MIKQLQRRFIRIAVVALTVAMVLVISVVNIANWISVRGELSNTLHLISEAIAPERLPGDSANVRSRQEKDGDDDDDDDERDKDFWQKPNGEYFPGRSRHFRNMVSEANWFTGAVTEAGEVKYLLLDQMENLDEETAGKLVRQAAESGQTEGYLQDYLYLVSQSRSGGTKVVMLNCETRLATVRTLVLISAVACACGILLALLLVTLASKKAIEPTVRNIEQQKQFITNASHELKTPLTVIATNMELLEMEEEGNPWVRSTQKQTAALRRLVDELVYLSRMEEEHPPLTPEELDPGRLLQETAEPFVSMAEYSGKEMLVEAEKGLQMTADRASLQRLMSTLCDNAVKYASGSPIRAEMRAEGKGSVLLRVSNPVAEPLTRQQCEQLFNRFYRMEESRNKDRKSGFGIGLAIAAAIAEKHGGRITAAMEGDSLVFSCVLPKEAKF